MKSSIAPPTLCCDPDVPSVRHVTAKNCRTGRTDANAQEKPRNHPHAVDVELARLACHYGVPLGCAGEHLMFWFRILHSA